MKTVKTIFAAIVMMSLIASCKSSQHTCPTYTEYPNKTKEVRYNDSVRNPDIDRIFY